MVLAIITVTFPQPLGATIIMYHPHGNTVKKFTVTVVNIAVTTVLLSTATHYYVLQMLILEVDLARRSFSQIQDI